MFGLTEASTSRRAVGVGRPIAASEVYVSDCAARPDLTDAGAAGRLRLKGVPNRPAGEAVSLRAGRVVGLP